MARFKATVEYDGTRFFGFQRQISEHITIQGELEAAIKLISQQKVPITAAGRTDSGVHARGQIISFDLSWRHGSEALQKAINANLPADIAVRGVESCSAEFHPRFNAKRRAYRYTVYNGPIRSPLLRRQNWHVKGHLDIDAMNTAAKSLIGEHDFATFGTPPQGTNTVRELFVAEWHQSGLFYIFDIVANAFLKRMVRSIVGTLKQVGEGSLTVDEFVAAFVAADRRRAGVTAPPQGLVLEHVEYE